MSAVEQVKPVLRYPGSKFRISPWILSFAPPHKTYVEPFMGGLSVLLSKTPSKSEYVNDLNGEIVNLFRVIRERGPELAAVVDMTPWSREEFTSAFEDCDEPIERARRTLVRYWQSVGADGTEGKRSGWRHNGAKKANGGVTQQWCNLPGRILVVAQRLKGVQVECRPATDVIARLDSPDTLFYVDPPYLGSTRRKGLYAQEMHAEQEHVELLEQLRTLKGMVILSGYPHRLYDEMLHGWERVEREAATNSGSSGTEVLWINPRATEERLGVLNAAPLFGGAL